MRRAPVRERAYEEYWGKKHRDNYRKSGSLWMGWARQESAGFGSHEEEDELLWVGWVGNGLGKTLVRKRRKSSGLDWVASGWSTLVCYGWDWHGWMGDLFMGLSSLRKARLSKEKRAQALPRSK